MPVLQHAGRALLEVGGAGNEDLVRRCADGLQERDGAGDDVLAMELLAELGEPLTSEHVPWPLTAVPVDLELLGGFLDGDPMQGDGAIDLLTGNVYPPGSLDWDRPEELDEDSEAFDPDRWLHFQPESGEAYRDMLDFAAGLPDGPLKQQLFLALEGRGAFRWFRNVLHHEAPGDQLTSWTLFRDERQLGRAREWFARAGYRRQPEAMSTRLNRHGRQIEAPPNGARRGPDRFQSVTGGLDLSYAVVVDSAAEVLTSRGPMTADQLVADLRDRGIDLGETPAATLEDAFNDEPAPAVLLTDDRWAWLPTLLAGRTFTHRMTEAEVAHDLLFVTADLAPAEPLLEGDDARLSDGTQVQSLVLPFDADLLGERGVPVDDIPEQSVLLLPTGYLSGRNVTPEDLIGLQVTADGVALDVLEVPDQPRASAELAQALGTVLEHREPEGLDTAIWSACAEHRELFRNPLPPLAEILPAYGLLQDVDWVARVGFDFARWRTDLQRDVLMHRYELTEDEALAVLAGTALYEQMSDLYDAATLAADESSSLRGLFDQRAVGQAAAPTGNATGFRATMKDALAHLDEPVVAVALLEQTTGYDATRAATLGLFAETLEPLAPRSVRPALRWLRAKAHELLGEIATAEQVMLDAESLDPDWPLTLFDLARYAFDRGDTARGLSLLHRADAPADDPMVQAFERYEAAPRTDLGRNDACWCGSGRKYKKCHLDSEHLPPEDRALWLYEKACLFLMDEPRRERHTELADSRARYADSDDEIWAAMTDPLVADALLFEGGALEDFLTTRGVLLPDDERLLVQQWLLTDRSVHEVTEIHPGASLTLRDLRTGDVHQVRERTAGQYLTTGQLICARIAPTGDTLQIFGGLEPVALHQRDELIALLDSEPDPHDLVEFLTRRFAPTVLQNTEGDPLVFCETTLRTDDPASLVRILDTIYDRADPAEPEWFDHVTTDGMRRVSATLRLEGDDLHIETNSEERHERVLAALHELVPAITLVTESRKPARDSREAAALAAKSGHDGGSVLDPDDPDVATALERYVRDYEQKWLDEPIPALAGVTPRQAADDPTRRADLIKLLDSFPIATAPGMMSPDLLRTALDLPSR